MSDLPDQHAEGAAPPQAESEPSATRMVEPPSVRAEQERRSQRILLLTIRLLFIVLLLTVSLLPFVGTITDPDVQSAPTFTDFLGPFLATVALGVVVILVDNATPNKRLSWVFGIYLGIIAGLVGALAIGALLDLVAESWELNRTRTGQAYLGLAKLAVGITLCYLAVSIVLTTKDDLRLVIPYVEFSKQVRGVRPLVLDTSVLIDGRIVGLGHTGFVDAPLVLPQFVIDELQTLADSGDKLKRARGRRGLGIVGKLQAEALVDITIDNADVPGRSVDHKLLHLAAQQHLRILTTDHNLDKVGQIQGVTVLNLNDIASMMRSQVIPGEKLHVEIVKPGEGPGQGVGYLPDGTMVVVEGAADAIGAAMTVTVTNALQTTAGRMIFARPLDGAEGDDGAVSHAEQIGRAATSQPRSTDRPRRAADRPNSPRNPRRG
jgi:uncharacterized protein YacL